MNRLATSSELARAFPVHTPSMRENAIQTIAVVRDIIANNERHLARINRGELADVGGYQGALYELKIEQARAVLDAQLQIVSGMTAKQIAETMGGVI